jgi:hypothetical protein
MKDFDWIDRSYDLFKDGKKEDGLDIVLDNLDDALCESDWKCVDDCLRRIDLERYIISAMLMLLSATRPAKDVLPYRETLVTNIEHELSRRAPDRVEKLLENLR